MRTEIVDITESCQDAAAIKSVGARIYEGRAARTHGPGDALQYSWGEAYRDDAGLDEIKGQLGNDKPFMLLHPATLLMDGGSGDIVGGVISSRVEGDHVVAKFYVTSPTAMDAISKGMHELSLGYRSVRDARLYQRKIRVDHLALVDRARCGPSCSLLTNRDCAGDDACPCKGAGTNTDGGVLEQDATPVTEQKPLLEQPISAAPTASETVATDGVQGDVQATPCKCHAIGHSADINAPGAENKDSILMNELEKKLADAIAEAATQKARADQAEKSLADAKTSLDAAESAKVKAEANAVSARKDAEAANAKAEKATADAATATEKAAQDAEDGIKARVAARVLLERAAGPLLKDDKGQPKNLDAMTDRDIKVAVANLDGITVDEKKYPDAKHLDAFVDGVYEGAVKRLTEASGSRAAVRQQVRANRDAAPKLTPADAERAALDAMKKDSAAAWQHPRK